MSKKSKWRTRGKGDGPVHGNWLCWECVDCGGQVSVSDEEGRKIQLWMEAGYDIESVVRRCLECSYKHHPPTNKRVC